MLYVDEAETFAGDLVGAPLSAGAPAGFDGDLWTALGGGASPVGHPHAAPAVAPFWHRGFLMARPGVSQYDALRRVTADAGGLPGHVWCLAGSGDACHGQRDRVWQALPGNLHLTVGLRGDPTLPAGAVLNALPAVATLDAVRELLGPEKVAGIKWVNDILVEGAKAAGCLTAARSRDGRVEAVFLGIGLNVAVAPDVMPDRFTPRVTDLARHAARPPRLAEAVAAVLTAVQRRWEELLAAGPGPLVAAYRAGCLVIGGHARLWPDTHRPAADPLCSGRIAGVDDDLGLVFADHDQPFRSGRLALDET